MSIAVANTISQQQQKLSGQGCILNGPHYLKFKQALHVPRILFVDDDPDIQTTIELWLRKYNVEVEVGFYGMQGIAEAVRTRPDLILTDLAMPNGGGEYLIECVKNNAQTAQIPVMVLTGMRDATLRHRLLNAGADVFLQKPVSHDELVHQMSRFIELRERKQGSK